ncbi:MAG TPA: hypothetical protein VE401_08680 [Solirubrobacterales bacterium]|nr:hypothetical protein [Solirubrobacterales bacterium]
MSGFLVGPGSCDLVRQVAAPREATDHGLRDGPFQQIRGQNRGQVEQGPRRTRGGNAVDGTYVAPVQGPNAVNADPGSPGYLPSDERDVDRTWFGWVGAQLQEVRGADVAHNRAAAAGEERRHLRGTIRHHAMTDQIDPAVHRMKSTCAKTPLDRAAIDARYQELRAADHPALSAGDRGDHPIGRFGVANRTLVVSWTARVKFSSHTDVKSTHALRAPASVRLSTASPGFRRNG